MLLNPFEHFKAGHGRHFQIQENQVGSGRSAGISAFAPA
jgi:hypothetical protein